MTYIYQVPCEIWNQFVKYLEAFKIAFEVKRDNSEGHTYGLIQVIEDNELQDDINSTLDKLIGWVNRNEK